MRHEIIKISQNDPRWQKAQLGDPKITPLATIGAYGCYITSFSAVAAFYGHNITPPDLNKLFLDNKLFSSGDLVSDDNDLSKVLPDIAYTTSLNFPNMPPTPANLAVLKDLVSDIAKTVIVMIDLGNGNAHFTPVVDCDGTTVTIMNVWNGLEQNFKDVYGDPALRILKYVVYHGNPIALDPLVCDRRSVRDVIVGKASNWDDIVNHGYATPQAVYDRIQSLTDQNKTLTENTVKIVTDPQMITSSTGPTVLVSPSTLKSSIEQTKKQSFWQTDIADLFKLFTKGGN